MHKFKKQIRVYLKMEEEEEDREGCSAFGLNPVEAVALPPSGLAANHSPHH